MDFTQLYNQLVQDFELESLSEQEREEALTEIGKTIQRQFLVDVGLLIGEEKFEALKQSANMGEEFYATTLKHLVPNNEELFQASPEKVKQGFKQGT